jgi:hypothetical protein
MSSRVFDHFLYTAVSFMGDLHDCHKCKMVLSQINGKGKKRTYCDKYKQAVQRVRWHCVDRFLGFNMTEMDAIEKQHKEGMCKLVIEGVAV